MNDGGKGENHSLRGLLPVSYNLFIRNNINYKSLNIGKMIKNQVMKRPMGNFLVEQRTKDLVPSFDELMSRDDKIENFSSLKEEFERKKEWDYDCLVSFNNRLEEDCH